MNQILKIRHIRSITEQQLNRQNYSQKQKPQLNIEEDSSELKFLNDSIYHQHELVEGFFNSQNHFRERYMTFQSQQQHSSNSISNRIKSLMQGLKQLIKELCLTKNAVQQIEEQLENIINSFAQAMYSLPNHRMGQAKSQFSNLSENRNRARFENFENLSHLPEIEIPWTLFFDRFLEGTVYQAQKSQHSQKVSSCQEEIFQQFMQKFFSLLQKQINRITKYNGQKKLRFLVQIVMKQVFVSLMRFSYDTRIELFKKKKKNYLNSPLNKAKIFASAIQRILSQNQLVSSAFLAIKYLIRSQNQADSGLLNKFETKVKFLDSLIKIQQRKGVRQNFLQWRKQSILRKELERQNILNEVSLMMKEIIHQFALNESDHEKWKIIIWSKINILMKKLCKFGQIIIFPVDDEFLSQSGGQKNLTLNSRAESRFKTQREPECFQYSPSSAGSDESYSTEHKLFDEINDLFSEDEIKLCLKNGEIVIKRNFSSKIILIPMKVVSSLIAIRNLVDENIETINEGNKISVNGFYKILSALQFFTPLILEIMQLSEKFEYFLSKIKAQSHQKFILKTVLKPEYHKISDHQINSEKNFHKENQTKKNLAASQLLSFTNRDEQKSCSTTFNQEKKIINTFLNKINATSFIVYHKKMDKIQGCVEYFSKDVDSLNSIGQQMIEAFATELQKSNKNSSEILRCLLIKRAKQSFYVCPLMKNKDLIGFVQINLIQNPKDGKDYIYNQKKDSAYIVKAIDEKNENFNEAISFLVKGIIPIVIEEKFKIDSISQTDQACGLLLNKCSHCFSFVKKTMNSLRFDERNSENFQSNISTRVRINQANTIFSVFRNLQGYSMLQTQKIIFKLIQQELENFKKVQNQSNQLFSNFPKNSLESLIDSELFSRIFYLENPRTKDGKIFMAQTKNNENKQQTKFYCVDLLSCQNNEIFLKIQFFDILRLFQKKKSINSQLIEVSVSQLIEIYRKMMRKDNPQNQSSKLNQGSLEQNDYQIFLEEMLKSVLLRYNEKGEFQKQYYSLELLLYQIQHYEKTHENKQIKFCLTLNPVFTFLDEKNKYLTAIIFHGGFVSCSDTKKNINLKQPGKNKIIQISKIIGKLEQQILSKIIWLQIKTTLVPNINNQTNNFLSIPKQMSGRGLNHLKHLEEQNLTPIQQLQRKLYSQKIFHFNKISKGISDLQNLFLKNKKTQIKKTIIPKFTANLKATQLRILNRLFLVIQQKILDKKSTTIKQISSQIIQKVKVYLHIKEYQYLLNILKFKQAMNAVFVRNKMLKTTFSILKQKPYNENLSSNQFKKINLVKKFAIERMGIIMAQKLFGRKLQLNSLCIYAFTTLKKFSTDYKIFSSLGKQSAALKVQSSIQKLLCKKAYLPYFRHLERLQKSIYESISLVGAEAQTIDFYSIYQFLRFIDERISIVIKSESKLIDVLYGNFVQKILLEIISQNSENNSFFKLSLSQSPTQKLQHSHVSPSIFNDNFQKIAENDINLIKIIQTSSNKLYFSFKFIENNDSLKIQSKTLADFKLMIRKVFQQNLVTTFEKFYCFYEKKIEALVLKVSKVFKIKTHFSERNKSKTILDDEKLRMKKLAFKKIESEILKISKIKQVNQISREAERKQKELEQLQNLYDKKSKNLTSQETRENLIEKDDVGQNIITKGMIKKQKQNIENLQMNSESLSIQYQIKSKTVASFRLIETINQRQRKESLKQVAIHLTSEHVSTQSFQQKQLKFESNLWKSFNSQNIIIEQKQKLGYFKGLYENEKSRNGQRLKKAGMRSIAKVLGNLNKLAYKKIFYRIKSFNRISSLKLVR